MKKLHFNVKKYIIFTSIFLIIASLAAPATVLAEVNSNNNKSNWTIYKEGLIHKIYPIFKEDSHDKIDLKNDVKSIETRDPESSVSERPESSVSEEPEAPEALVPQESQAPVAEEPATPPAAYESKTLKFSYRNGSKGIANKEITFGETYGELPVTSRDNYEFRGWFTQKYGGEMVTSDTVVTTNEDTTLYAQWEWKQPVKKMYTKKGSKARSGIKRNGFAGVTIHNTDNTGKTADALSHGKYLKGSGKNAKASWHYCVDDEIATASIPEKERALHAGDGTGKGNSKTIGIEICVNKGGDLFDATENGAKLAADILHRNGVKEAKSGVNVHQHNYFSSFGKDCPKNIRAGDPYNWKTFVERVNYYLDQM